MENNTNENNIEQIEIKETITITKENNKKEVFKTIASAIIVIGFLIAGAILLKDSKGNVSVKSNSNKELTGQDIELAPITSEDHILGNPNAKIKIVEYSDTGCPFCRMFHITMHKIVEKSDEKVT